MANKLKSTTIQGDLLVTSNTKVDGTIIGNVSGNATSADKVDINSAANGTSLKVVATDAAGTKTPVVVSNVNISIAANGVASISVNGSVTAANVTATTLSGNGSGITNISASNITGNIDESLIDITKKANLATAASTAVTLGNTSQALTINATNTTVNGDTSFTGNVNVSGNVNIGGGIAIQGDKTIVNATTLSTTDKLIELGKGNTVALTNYAGFYVPKYDGTNTGALVFDNNGVARVGDVTVSTDGTISSANSSSKSSKTSLQPLATRNESISDGSLLKWDNSNSTITGASASDIKSIYISDTNNGKLAFISDSGNTSNVYRSNISVTSKNSISGIEGITSNTVTTNTVTATLGITTATLNSDAIVNGKIELSKDTLIVKGSNNATVISLSTNGNITASTASIPTVTGNLSGNATTATTLKNSRNFSISGGATAAAVGFNGSGNVELNVTAVQPSVIASGTIGAANAKVNLVGNAESATVASSLSTSSKGSTTLPVYFANGVPVVTSTTLGVCISGIANKSDNEYIKALTSTETITYLTGVTGNTSNYYQEKHSGIKATISNNNIELSATGSVNITGQAKTVAETINLGKNTSGSINLATATGSRTLDILVTNIGDTTLSTNVPVHQILSIDSDKALKFNGTNKSWSLKTSTNDLIIDSDGTGKTIFNKNTDVIGTLRAPLIKSEAVQMYLSSQSNSNSDYIKLEPRIKLNDAYTEFYGSFLVNRYTYNSSSGVYVKDNIKTTTGSEDASNAVLYPVIVDSSNNAIDIGNDNAAGQILKLYQGGIVAAREGIDYLTASGEIAAKTIYASPIDQNTENVNSYKAYDTTGQVTENTSNLSNVLFMPFYQLTTIRRTNNSVNDNGYELKAVLPQSIISRDSSGNASIATETDSSIYRFPYIERKISGTDVKSNDGYVIHGKITSAEAADVVNNFKTTNTINNKNNLAVFYNTASTTTKSSVIPSGQAIVTTKDSSNNVILSGITYTNANTASTIVYRDGNGNFSAGTITANLSGNASTATTATYASKSSGMTFTGPISYQGTKATYQMIKFKDNTADAYGNGIVIGGGGLTVIGGGESADTIASGLSAGTEALYLTSDTDVFIKSSPDNGSTYKTWTFGSNGTLTAPGTIVASLSGNASTATKLANSRKITVVGQNLTAAVAATTAASASFDGSSDITISINRKTISDALGFDPVDDASAMTYKGTIASTTTLASTAIVNGDVYVADGSASFNFKYDSTTGAVLGASSSTGTSITVEPGDMLIYNSSAKKWNVIEKNTTENVSFTGTVNNILANELPIYSAVKNKNITKSGITITAPSGSAKGKIDADITGYAATAGSASSATNATNATNARYVIGDNNAASPGGALLQSGAGRADQSTSGDTWIFYDSLGGTSTPWGVRHDQGPNTLSFIGAGTVTSNINLQNGNICTKGSLDVTGDAKISGSITNLAINGGIYWNPYVESATDGTDAASITVVKNGNGSGGTVLQIRQANDAGDIINLVAGDAKVNGYSIIHANNIGSQSVASAAVATSLSTASAGSSTVPVYFSNGIPVVTSTTLGVCITGTASKATTVAVTAIASTTNSEYNLTSVDGSGNIQKLPTMTYNPSKNTLTAGTFKGALSGNAATATTATNAHKLTATSTTNTETELAVGSTTLPVYFSGGVPVVTSTTLGVCISGKASTAGAADTATTATNLSGTTSNSIPYQSGSKTTSYKAPVASNVLGWDSNKAITSYGIANANTASTLVYRDGSGNFSAGTITANLSGNASTATKATTVTVTNIAATTNYNYNVTSVDANGNIQKLPTLTYNPNTNTLTAGKFSGALSGNASTASQIYRNQLGSTTTGYLAAFTATTSANASAYVTSSISIKGNVITANLSGNASTATKATTVTVTDIAATTDSDYNVTSVDSSGNIQKLPNLTYNPNKDTLTLSHSDGTNTVPGTVNANLTGDVSGNLNGNASTASQIYRNQLGSTTTGYLAAFTATTAANADTYVTSSISIKGSVITATLSGNASTATNLTGTTVNSIPYQSASKTTSYISPAKNTVLGWNGAASPVITKYTVTNANTASTIVYRDGNGNFSAGTITANLSGNASTATKTTYITVGSSVTSTTNAEKPILTIFTDASSNSQINELPNITYNPSTNALTLSRTVSNNVVYGTVNANLTGNVSGNASTATKIYRNQLGSTTTGYLAAFTATTAANADTYVTSSISIKGNVITANLNGNASTASAVAINTNVASGKIVVPDANGVLYNTKVTVSNVAACTTTSTPETDIISAQGWNIKFTSGSIVFIKS